MTEKPLVGTNAEYIEACCRAADQLTERDLEIIESSHPHIAKERRAERAKALAKEADAARIKAQQSATAAGANNRREHFLIDAIASGMAVVLKELFTPRDTRIEALERRLAEVGSQAAIADARVKAVESRPGLEYLGTWTEGRGYVRGSVVTLGGSLWIQHKMAVSVARPGTAEGAAAWTLAVKKGADGKDATPR
jgi:hypothetical protein